MKKTLIALTSISVVLGAGYAAWVYTPIGKKTLAKLLLKRWGTIAENKGKELDTQKLTKELAKLSYADHWLLFKSTKNNMLMKGNAYKKNHIRGLLSTKEFRLEEKKINDNLVEIIKSNLLGKADLSVLKDLIIPDKKVQITKQVKTAEGQGQEGKFVALWKH